MLSFCEQENMATASRFSLEDSWNLLKLEVMFCIRGAPQRVHQKSLSLRGGVFGEVIET